MTITPESWEQQLRDAAHAIPDTFDDIGDTEGQPDGITNDSHDLPTPANAARRTYEFLSWFGDGIVYGGEDDQPPLYARDLEALRKEHERVDGLEAINRELRAENARLRAAGQRIADKLHGSYGLRIVADELRAALSEPAADTTPDDEPRYARIHVRPSLDADAWPVVERVPGGWQSGQHHYPDSDVLQVIPLPIHAPTTEES